MTVIGTSKGKGFQGVVKRHHFRGGAATHGSMFHRAPGLHRRLGVPLARLKGMRGGRPHGRGAHDACRTSTVVRVDAEKNILVVKGAVPGAGGGYLIIREGIGTMAEKQKKATPAPSEGRGAAEGGQPRRRRPGAGRTAKPKAAAPTPAADASRDGREGAVAGGERRATRGARARRCTPRCSGCSVNEHLLYEAVKQYRAGARRGHAHDQEPRRWSRAPARSPGGRRAPAAPASARPAPRSGATAAPCSGPVPRDYSY